MHENKGIKRAVLKVVRESVHPLTSRETTEMVRKTIPDVDVLNKSVRAMLSMSVKAGVIAADQTDNRRYLYYAKQIDA